MFLTVTWRLLIILVTRDAIRPCDSGLSMIVSGYFLWSACPSSVLTLGHVRLGSDAQKLCIFQAFKLGSLRTALLLFGVIGRFG